MKKLHQGLTIGFKMHWLTCFACKTPVGSQKQMKDFEAKQLETTQHKKITQIANYPQIP